MHTPLVVLSALGLTAAVLPAAAQRPVPPAVTQGAPGINRTIPQRADLPGTKLETIVALLEVAPGFRAGGHIDPADAMGYVLEGEFRNQIDGEPAKVIKAGEALIVPAGAVHDEGTDAAAAKVVITYVVEKGKPLAAPVK
jgi:quercetin dioxygenase-like cupin family protein